MDKAIVYALFGSNKPRHEGCFPFESYLTSMMLSIRLNRLVFPGWLNIIETDEMTYSSYKDVFDYLQSIGVIKFEVNGSNVRLCEGMLWRLKPIWWKKKDEYEFTHILCRDLDSLHTYREAQAVKVWMDGGKAAHAITDSTSHTIAMMGGMIGFVPREFPARTGFVNWDDMMRYCDYDLSRKGTDQHFINERIYPRFSQPGEDSITQHYFKGMPNTWLSDYRCCKCWLYQYRAGHNEGCPEDVHLPNVPPAMKETNEVSEHMGAAGYNQIQTMKIVHDYADQFQDLIEIEKRYPHIFPWSTR